jgi:hypothetical protein
MPKRIKRMTMAIASLAALGGGAAAIASAQGTSPTPPTPAAQAPPIAEQLGGPDTDNIQAGDQTTPEQPGSETESAPNSDGPGGHADEPGNATADHQFQGEE